MKKNCLFSIAALSMALLAFSGCSDTIDYGADGNGEGRVLIHAALNNDVAGTVSSKAPSRNGSRAGVADDNLAASTIVWISNSQGVVRKFNGIAQVPAEGIWLKSDNYVAEAWAGDSVSASFDKKYFKARQPFSLNSGQTLQIDLECKIANVVVEVRYDDIVKDLLENVKLEAGHDRGSLTFEGFEMEKTPGYFMMPSTDKNIAYTFSATDASTGSNLTKKGVIENAKPGYKYILNVKHDGGGSQDPIGGGIFTIEVDESEIVVEDRILIESAPVISGLTLNLAEPIVGEPGKLTEQKLWIQSVTDITEVEISCPTGFDALGIGGSDFEIFKMTDDVKAILNQKGFSYHLFTHKDDADNPDFQEMKLVFGEAFMNLLPTGDHAITIKATDANGRTGMAVMNVMLTGAAIQTVEIDASSPSIWATEVTLSGRVLKENQTGVGFNWREAGSSQWNFIAAGDGTSSRSRGAKRALAAGDTYTAVLTGLTPGTEYEYQAVSDEFKAEVFSLTTEAPLQLGNAGFEEWGRFKSGNDKKDVLHIASSAENMFWDSGNHGSKTMNKEVTEQASDKVHSGQYSAKLCSQFVGIGPIGKFAAGNLFAGRYLNTDGTDGELGWGRPFTSRPKALRGWIHYTPGTVEYEKDACPDKDLVKGKPDKGIIYIAIVDATTTPYGNENWPCVVKTKTTELFNPRGANVIAYGEKVFTEATSGNDLVEFEIPLEYYRKDTKAVNIIVVVSASKGGDYFVGGKSTMYVDDFELVY